MSVHVRRDKVTKAHLSREAYFIHFINYTSCQLIIEFQMTYLWHCERSPVYLSTLHKLGEVISGHSSWCYSSHNILFWFVKPYSIQDIFSFSKCFDFDYHANLLMGHLENIEPISTVIFFITFNRSSPILTSVVTYFQGIIIITLILF